MRKLLGVHEEWSDDGGDFRHVGYVIAWEEGGKQYRVEHKGRTYDLDKLEAPPPVPSEYLTTPWLSTYKEAHQPLPPDTFIKSNSVIRIVPSQPTLLPRLMHREIDVYTTISRSPHPNICHFYGCVRDGDRATGLILQKIPHELPDRWSDTPTQHATPKLAILRGIKRGLDHLHALGYVHNDINTGNILLDDSFRPVIIDFNTALPEGEVKEEYQGTPGWFRKSPVSLRDNDIFALGLLAKWLDGWEEDPSGFIESEEPCSWTEDYLAPKVLAVASPSKLYNSILSRAFYTGAHVTLLNGDSASGGFEMPPHLMNTRINSVSAQSRDQLTQAWDVACGGLRTDEVDVALLPISSDILNQDNCELLQLRDIIATIPLNLRPRRMQPRLVLFDTDSSLSSDAHLQKLEHVLGTLVRDCWKETGGLGGATGYENDTLKTDEVLDGLNDVFNNFVLVQPGGWFSWGRLRISLTGSATTVTGLSFERKPRLVAPDDLIDWVLEPPEEKIGGTRGYVERTLRRILNVSDPGLLALVAAQAALAMYAVYKLSWAS